MTTPDTKAIRAKAKMWHLPAGITDDILALCDALDELRADNERLAKVRDNLSKVEQLHREQANSQFHRANKAEAERDEARASVAEAMKHLHDIINCGNCSGSRQSARLALRALAAMETSHD